MDEHARFLLVENKDFSTFGVHPGPFEFRLLRIVRLIRIHRGSFVWLFQASLAYSGSLGAVLGALERMQHFMRFQSR